jgi:hypothetical protein
MTLAIGVWTRLVIWTANIQSKIQTFSDGIGHILILALFQSQRFIRLESGLSTPILNPLAAVW